MTTIRAASVDCLYGDTGTTKTSRLGDAAEYYFELTHKPAHLVCTDNAGWGPLDSQVEEGVIIPYKISMARPHLISDFAKLSQGYWPKDVSDPFSELIPCPVEDVSVLLWDGITNTCSMLMEVHQKSVKWGTNKKGQAGMEATDVRVPEMPDDSFVRSGDDYMRRFLGRSDYMGVQDRAAEYIRNMSMLPIPVVCTALEAKGEDEQKKPIYGPQFIGKALTGVCGPWFSNLIHLDFLTKVVTVADPTNPGKMLSIEQPQPIMFLKNHFDPNDPLKIKYPAKVRAPRTMHQDVPPIAPPDLKALYKFLDGLREKERATLLKVEAS